MLGCPKRWAVAAFADPLLPETFVPRFRPRFAALAVVAGAGLAVVVPVFAAGNTNATLSDYKIAGPASAKAGVVTFKVKNAAGELHELVVIKTPTKAAKMMTKNGRASEAGSLGEVEVKGGARRRFKLTLKPGHYVLLCDVGSTSRRGCTRTSR